MCAASHISCPFFFRAESHKARSVDDGDSSLLSLLPHQYLQAAACNETQLISLSTLRTTLFHVVDLRMVYFLNMKAVSAVPSPQCRNKNSTFPSLPEHFAGNSILPALLPQRVYHCNPLMLSQADFRDLGLSHFTFVLSPIRGEPLFTLMSAVPWSKPQQNANSI